MSYPQVHNITFSTFGASSDLLPKLTINQLFKEYIMTDPTENQEGRSLDELAGEGQIATPLVKN